MIAKLERTQSNVQQNIEQLQTLTGNNKQKVNNNRTIALERIAAYATGGGGGGLNASYWYQIFARDSAAVELQEMVSSHGGMLTNAIYHHGETL